MTIGLLKHIGLMALSIHYLLADPNPPPSLFTSSVRPRVIVVVVVVLVVVVCSVGKDVSRGCMYTTSRQSSSIQTMQCPASRSMRSRGDIVILNHGLHVVRYIPILTVPTAQYILTSYKLQDLHGTVDGTCQSQEETSF